MERVIVIGSSCAGKTTLARRVAEVIESPHIELDAIHWGPNWREAPTEEFRAAVRRLVEGQSWVIDGNYSKVRDIVWPRATDAVWLNYSFPVVFARALAGEGIAHEVLDGEGPAGPEVTGSTDSPATPARVVLVPATTAKGLEYDRVVVVEPAAIAAAEPDPRTGLRRLYVVLTRAVSGLVVVHSDPLPGPLAT